VFNAIYDEIHRRNSHNLCQINETVYMPERVITKKKGNTATICLSKNWPGWNPSGIGTIFTGTCFL